MLSFFSLLTGFLCYQLNSEQEEEADDSEVQSTHAATPDDQNTAKGNLLLDINSFNLQSISLTSFSEKNSENLETTFNISKQDSPKLQTPESTQIEGNLAGTSAVPSKSFEKALVCKTRFMATFRRCSSNRIFA